MGDVRTGSKTAMSPAHMGESRFRKVEDVSSSRLATKSADKSVELLMPRQAT